MMCPLYCCFQDFLSLSFNISIVMCLAVGHFGCVLLGICWASWIYRLLFIIKFWDFFQPFYWIHFLLLFLLSLWSSHSAYVSALNDVWGTVHFSPFFYLLFGLRINLPSRSLIISFASSNLLLSPFIGFFISFTVFSTQEFPFNLYNFYPFIIILWWHCCHTFLFKAWFLLVL